MSSGQDGKQFTENLKNSGLDPEIVATITPVLETSTEVIGQKVSDGGTIDSNTQVANLTGGKFEVSLSNSTNLAIVDASQATVKTTILLGDLGSPLGGSANPLVVIGGSNGDLVGGKTISGGPSQSDRIAPSIVETDARLIVDGGAGDDTITGGGNSDSIRGGEGSDSLTGGEGRDTIIAGPGNDTINAGDDWDTVILQTGRNAFNVEVDNGTLVLTNSVTGAVNRVSQAEYIRFEGGNYNEQGVPQTDSLVILALADDQQAQVARLYESMLGRAADSDGLRFWLNELQNGLASQDFNTVIKGIATSFALTPEFEARFGETSDEQFLNALYATAFGRTPDADGQAYWLNELASGVSRAEVAMNFALSAEGQEAFDYIFIVGASNTDIS